MSPSYLGRSTSLAALTALALAVGCAAPSGEPDAAEASEAVMGGVVDETHPTAGLLILPTQGICGGTLVAPNVVATAAHCMKETPTAFYLGKGAPVTVLEPASKALAKMTRHEVSAGVIFPTFDRARGFAADVDASTEYVCDEGTIDLALVRLRAPVSGLAPTPMAPAPSVGTECEVVGFSTHKEPGATFETTHERRMAHRRVETSPTYRVFSTALDGRTRRGDSGGGLFCAGKLVGVLACSSASRDDHAGLEKVRGWIDWQIKEWAR